MVKKIKSKLENNYLDNKTVKTNLILNKQKIYIKNNNMNKRALKLSMHTNKSGK